MKEIRQKINFNAFHILIIVVFIITMINGNYIYLFELAKDLISLNFPQFWFLVAHLFAFYSILASLEFELDFRAAIKWNF
jgi:hypothetical protein